MSDLLFYYLNFSEFPSNAAFVYSALIFYVCIINCHRISDLNMCIYCIIVYKGQDSRSSLVSSSAQGLIRL